VLQSEPPRLLQYTFAIGSSSKISRLKTLIETGKTFKPH